MLELQELDLHKQSTSTIIENKIEISMTGKAQNTSVTKYNHHNTISQISGTCLQRGN
jgi:hypothetical protein